MDPQKHSENPYHLPIQRGFEVFVLQHIQVLTPTNMAPDRRVPSIFQVPSRWCLLRFGLCGKEGMSICLKCNFRPGQIHLLSKFLALWAAPCPSQTGRLHRPSTQRCFGAGVPFAHQNREFNPPKRLNKSDQAIQDNLIDDYDPHPAICLNHLPTWHF